MGTLFFDNKIPYINGWDHKGISIYLINALGYLVGFKNYIGIRILEIILILFSFLSIYKTLIIKFSKKTVFIAILFGLFSFKYFFDGGNLTEEYGALSVILALSLLLRNNKNTIHYSLIGILFIINLTIRANLISFWVALFFTILISDFYNNINLVFTIKKLLKIGLGAIVGIIILGVYFILTDSFSQFYNAAFVYNFSYTKQSFSNIILFIIKSTRIYDVSIIMLFALLISTIAILKKKSTFTSILLLIWIPLELYFGNMSGKGFAHYYMMWTPIILLSVVYILDYYKEIKLNEEKKLVLFFMSFYLFFQIPVFSTVSNYKSLFNHKKSKNKLVAEHINKTYNKETILVWGNECSIYNLTNKKATVTNFYQTSFKLDTPITKEIIKNFNKQIKQKPPKIIIDVKTPSLLFLDLSNIDNISKKQQENLKDFFIFFNNNYILKESIEGIDFYIKK